jgi:hypothetical protein
MSNIVSRQPAIFNYSIFRRILSCGILETPRFGRKSNFQFTPGAIVTFECNEGFFLNGDRRRVCMEDGRWDLPQYGYTECLREWLLMILLLSVARMNEKFPKLEKIFCSNEAVLCIELQLRLLKTYEILHSKSFRVFYIRQIFMTVRKDFLDHKTLKASEKHLQHKT